MMKPKITSNSKTDTANEDQRDLTLTEEEAKAGAPSDESVTGEEDPGVGLEFLVKRKQPPKRDSE